MYAHLGIIAPYAMNDIILVLWEGYKNKITPWQHMPEKDPNGASIVLHLDMNYHSSIYAAMVAFQLGETH